MAVHWIMSLRWLAPMAMVGALGLTACVGDDPPDTVEVSAGNRAAKAHEAERSREFQKERGSPACKWISVGAPPTPDYVAVLENCDTEWTGNMQWLQTRAAGAMRRLVEPPARVAP
jgi:hypothetical protein